MKTFTVKAAKFFGAKEIGFGVTAENIEQAWKIARKKVKRKVGPKAVILWLGEDKNSR
jgi:hypothetical protein